MYIALIADVIDSKLFKERSDLQKRLEAVLFHMNNRFETYLASRLTLTLGDEFQALFTLDAPIFQIIDSLRQDLKPAQLRFGIGLGKIVTDIDPLQSIGADGPAYWNARRFSNKCFISCRRGNQIRLARKSGRTFKGFTQTIHL